ncbi:MULTISPECIES: CpsD/CapB family tyrosine-protein kinase [Paenibacillus]|uniref:non-specific protein-tyrosine kinase n=1 Tax=Paenibacillus glycanilyticus TaxID=126569 RepID=A0ABQ6NVH9_9BACL|nr:MULTISPECIES: CpsD/CapB family tyrosine-protein kinase [Paenibacillus]MCK9861642.1 CpsD/CapB family tyrosine-protein kinase [Paenibacillus sp. ATY16]GMK49108.1 tyrosine protein kinase [Paenibacillus glycanilyticus]
MSRSDLKLRPVVAEANPTSPISEAYRTLRTNLQYAETDRPLQLLMVTSAGPEEGKSTTIMNLAVTYAQMERRTILVDADLRKPTSHYNFGLSNRTGLSHVLSGQADLSEVIKETRIKGLDVLPSGPVPPNPSELLGSSRMEELLGKLREQYDMVLIDTPPVLAVADAQVVANKCDGVLLVVNARTGKKQHAIKAKNALQFVQARIVGIALNQTAHREAGPYYEYVDRT